MIASTGLMINERDVCWLRCRFAEITLGFEYGHNRHIDFESE